MGKILIAKEILNKYPNYINEGGIGRSYAEEAMIEFATQFVDLAVEKAFVNIDNGYDDWEDINNIILEGRVSISKESILKIKELIK